MRFDLCFPQFWIADMSSYGNLKVLQKVLLIHCTVSIDFVSGQRRPWSDCADAQAETANACWHVFAWRVSNNADQPLRCTVFFIFLFIFFNFRSQPMIIFHLNEQSMVRHRKIPTITKTRLSKYKENFISKNWKFSDKKLWYFSYFCS